MTRLRGYALAYGDIVVTAGVSVSLVVIVLDLVWLASLCLFGVLLILFARTSLPGHLLRKFQQRNFLHYAGSDTDESEVTVVIPMYNEQDYVGSCLRSLVNQSYKNWKAIIVDDASTDGSVDVLQGFLDSDTRFKLLRHTKNAGLAATRNTGLEAVSTQYVTFLDADDCLLNQSIQRRLELLRVNDDPDVAGVFCGIIDVPEHYPKEGEPLSTEFTADFVDFLTTQGECPFSVHAPIVKTSVLSALGGFDESMVEGAEDWDLWLRVLREGFYFEPLPQIGAVYRQKPTSLVRKHAAAHVRHAKELYEISTKPYEPVINQASPFRAPIQELNAARLTAGRVISFAAMAYCVDSVDAMRSVLKEMPDLAGSYLDRHLSINALVSAGVVRGMNSSYARVNRQKLEFDERVKYVGDEVRELLRQLDSQRSAQNS